jgi:hypothetical protein
MTQSRNALPPSSATDLAVSALTGQGRYGTVSTLADEHDVSRKTVYQLREQARDALTAAFAAARVEAPRGSFTWTLTERDVERTIVALRVVTPSSIRDIVAMLPIVYGFGWSYGKIWSVLRRAEQQAKAFLMLVDLAGIKTVALDEMFSQGRPVFAGIDLDTQYLFQLEVHERRTGEAWAKSLGLLRDWQGLVPERVVKDAGSGLARGVQLCWSGKPEERDDLFHAVYMMGKEAYHLERRAYAAIDKEEEALRLREQAKEKAETDRRRVGQLLRKARKNANKAIDRYDTFEAARQEARRVLDLTDTGSGRLRTSVEVVEVLTRVGDQMKALGGRVGKVGRYLRNRAPGLGRYLDALGERLRAVTPQAGGPEAVEAVVRAYQASLDAGRGGSDAVCRKQKQELRAASLNLLAIGEEDPEHIKRAMTAVIPELTQRHRASSAIENLNSVLRPYLVVQKHAEQGFLNLFRFHWNTRKREWGRGKGTSAYEQLTGVRVNDWPTLLGFPPGEAFANAA